MTDNLPVELKWEKGFVVDYAMNMASSTSGMPLYETKDLMAHWNMSPEMYEAITRDPKFIQEYRAELKAVKEAAPHLQRKAQILLEAWLNQSAGAWLGDDSNSLSERTKVLEQVIKVAGILEKGKAAAEGAGQNQNSGPTLNLILQTSSPITNVEKVIN